VTADQHLGDEGLGEVEPPAAAAASLQVGDWLGRPLTPTLSRGTADRSEDRRHPEHVATGWPKAKLLVIGPEGRVSADTDGNVVRLNWLPAADLAAEPPADAVLLGNVEGIDHWVVPGDVPAQPADQPDRWGRTGGGLRQWGAQLDDTEAGLLTTATAVTTWHRLAPYCPRCGELNSPSGAGWSRICANGHQEFPRTDPAVIVLVHDGADRMVLARQPIWPEHRFSVLAGFTEAGESLESTVVREVWEEVGLRVGDVRYLGSQPWPFPRSLMVGFAARAEPGAELHPRKGEIEAAIWVSRQEIVDLLDDESGARSDLMLPTTVSIARQLIERWARG
jgi:NAD+ diphosphatase